VIRLLPFREKTARMTWSFHQVIIFLKLRTYKRLMIIFWSKSYAQ
jgi:hypothetical protein